MLYIEFNKMLKERKMSLNETIETFLVEALLRSEAKCSLEVKHSFEAFLRFEAKRSFKAKRSLSNIDVADFFSAF